MGKMLVIEVKESNKSLKVLYNQVTPTKQKRIQMLLLMQKVRHPTKASLALALGVSGQSIQTWRSNYKKGGLELLLNDQRKGLQAGIIPIAVKENLQERLSSPTDGFTSYLQVQQWLKDSYGIAIKYHALYKFLRRNFKVKLKVARKSHVQKDAAQEGVFKKSAFNF